MIRSQKKLSIVIVKDIVYFNNREGYLRKLFPLNKWVIISGKVNYFNKNYQITNPDYVTSTDKQNYVVKNIPKSPPPPSNLSYKSNPVTLGFLLLNCTIFLFVDANMPIPYARR